MADATNDAYVFFKNPGTGKIGPVNIHGESYDQDDETWFGYASEIKSVTFGVASEGKTGQLEDSVKVDVKDVTITKITDWATPKYILAMVTGARFKEATILLRTNFEEYLRIVCEDVTVKSVDFSQSDADQPLDTINLEFAAFTFRYKGVEPPQDLKDSDGQYSECYFNKESNKVDTQARG